MENEKASSRGHDAVAMKELMQDPELEHLYAERIASMQKEAEKRQKLERKGHGELQEVQVEPLCVCCPCPPSMSDSQAVHMDTRSAVAFGSVAHYILCKHAWCLRLLVGQ